MLKFSVCLIRLHWQNNLLIVNDELDVTPNKWRQLNMSSLVCCPGHVQPVMGDVELTMYLPTSTDSSVYTVPQTVWILTVYCPMKMRSSIREIGAVMVLSSGHQHQCCQKQWRIHPQKKIMNESDWGTGDV